MKTVICYGDSNTHGYNPADGGRFSRQKRWTGILQSLLGNDYYVVEEGCNGRTTVWDDPIEEYRNGKKYLIPCLQSHYPVDLVVLMLGTNDLKTRFSVSSTDVQRSVENLIKTIQKSEMGPGGQAPEILLLCPIQIGELTGFSGMFDGAKEKCEKLPPLYKESAEKYNTHYLNAGDYAKADVLDGLHIGAKGQVDLAQALCRKIQEIF